MFKHVATLVGLAITPLYAASFLALVLYRVVGHLWLEYTRPNYAGLLDVLEEFYDKDENSVNLSVASGLLNVKLTSINSGEELRRSIIEKAERILSKKSNKRLKCVVEKRYKLKFWRVDNFDVAEQIIPFVAKNKHELERYLSAVSNTQIRGKRLFEVHVGTQPINDKYPIICRIHHSLGDGYAMRKALIEEQSTEASFYSETSNASNGKSFWMKVRQNATLARYFLTLFIRTPTLFVEQYFLMPRDKNSLKTDRVSGEKLLRFGSGELRKIKEIQRNSGMTFTEILLSAMSKSLDDVFKSRKESVPYVTIIFPVRESQNSNAVANSFIPAGFQLPVDTLTREADIVRGIRQLHETPSYKINYFLPRFAFILFPMNLPEWVYDCTEFTGVFTNIPGPKESVEFKEFKVEDFAFFTPNLIRNHGMGVLVTSYGDKFICTATVDRSVTKSDEDAQKIVDGIINYIESTHMKLKSE